MLFRVPTSAFHDRITAHCVASTQADSQTVYRPPEPPVHELVLLVLHEHEAAAARVVQDSTVVRDQRRLGLVRAAADYDRVVPCEIAAGECVGSEQLHGHAHRGQLLGHPVGGAPHV